MMRKMMSIFAAPLSIGLLMSGTALAQDEIRAASAEESDRVDAQEIVREAAGVIDQMKSDGQVAQLLDNAEGVYVVPDFGRAGLIVGGRGGAGVMLAHTNGSWSNPAFYDFGAISLGAQAGVSTGSVAFILTSQDAVGRFSDENNFSLNSEAGLSIIDYSENAQASYGKGDVVFWSDTEGAYAGATIDVSDVNFDEEKTSGYYGRTVSPQKILPGNVRINAAEALKSALSG